MSTSANTPLQIDPNQWWSILKTTYAGMQRDNISLVAAGVAFYTLLSLFPLLFALVSVIGLLVSPAELAQYFEDFTRILPPGSGEVVYQHAERIVSGSDARLTLGLLLSLAVALWSSSKGANALIIACNIAYEEQRSIGLLAMMFVRMAFALAAIIVLGASLLLVSWITLVSQTAWWLEAVLWLLFVVLILISIGLVYRYAPHRRRAKWRWIAPGAVLALLFWAAATAGFGLYVTHYADYNQTYGSLGGVVLLVVWFYLSALVLLGGAKFNAAMELHLRPDSTAGEDRPRGQRGAYVADNLPE